MALEPLWNMRVTLNLRKEMQRIEKGRVAPVMPFEEEPDLDVLIDKWMLYGTPDQVSRRILRYQEELGMTHINCAFWSGDMPQKKVISSMELFAREVMPCFTREAEVARVGV